VKPGNFDTRTRVGETRRTSKTTYYRRRSRTGLKLLAFGGIALIVASVALVLVDARLIGTASTPSPAPKNETLRLTVPKMKRVQAIPVFTAAPDNTAKLDAGAIHVKGTGSPWEEEANVYIAGHRLGYPNTESFLAFFDLDNLKDGDEVFVEDADGTKYTYKVFKEITVSPTDVSVTRPVSGKNVLTLQTCTLPDYSERLIVQAELVDKEA